MSAAQKTAEPRGAARSAEARKAQLGALVPDRSVWVAASAGTGKTTVLTSRVLSLLLNGTPPERILCLTFTKAAAAEMAGRIAGHLKDWATIDDGVLDSRLHYLLGRAPDDGERQLARRLFAQVLDLPGGLAVRTIHSFCQSLLGRFPLEAGIAPNSTLLEERAAAELLADQRERLLAEIASGEEPALAAAIGRIAVLSDDNALQSLLGSLSAQSGALLSVFEQLGLAGYEAALGSYLGVSPEDTPEALLAEAVAEDSFDRAGLTHATQLLLGSSKRDQGQGELLAAWLEQTDDAARRARLDDYRGVFFTKNGNPKADKTLITDSLENANPGTRAILRQEGDRLAAVLDKVAAARMLAANLQLMTFTKALLSRFAQAKREAALLDYGDLIEKVRLLLRPGDTLNAWVLFKLDGGLDHILVDESQDTNRAQWDVIDGLAAEFFAGLGAHEDRSDAVRTIFSVGDVKQSIFSFQGAEPATFLSERERYRARLTAIDQRLEDVELNYSFRSTSAVLETVDKVFGESASGSHMLLGEAWQAHQAVREGHAGLVELWPTVGPVPLDNSDPWDAPREPQDSASGAARLARHIAELLQSWFDADPGPGDDAWLESQGRPIAPGDVMILVRRRKHIVDEMIRALKERGIPVAGVDQMVLTEQLAVQDLMALGRAMLLPEDDLNLAGLLKSPFIGLTEDQLFQLAYGRKGRGLWSVLRDRRKEDRAFERAADFLEEMAEKADYLSPFAFYAQLLSAKGGRKALLSRLGEDAGDPIDEFLNQALVFERESHPSLEGFLHWLEAGSQKVKRDLDRGEGLVRVITVHGAKGLEAPVVFLPDSYQLPDEKHNPLFWIKPEGSNHGLELPLWTAHKSFKCAGSEKAKNARRQASMEEYQRLLYVALTRARDRLYVAGYETGKSQRSAEDWHSLVKEALGDLGETFGFTSLLPAPLGWEGEGWRYRQRQTIESSAPDDQRAAQQVTPLPEGWPTAPAPLEPASLDILRPSGAKGDVSEDEPPAASPRPVEGEEISGIDRGLIIHRLLELLPGLEPDRQQELGAQLLARPLHGLSKGLQRSLLAETLEVLRHPEFAPIFGPGSVAEAPVVGEITTRSGEKRLLSGQIDRLLITENQILVVDYKTNRPPPAVESEVSPVYLVQMAAYRAVLRQIYPGREVKSALLWTHGPRLMHISHDLLDHHAP